MNNDEGEQDYLVQRRVSDERHNDFSKAAASRQARAVIEDEAVDLIKQDMEANGTFMQKYKFLMIVGLWVFLSNLQGLTMPFLTKIKSDQLGGDQRAGEIQSIVACVGATVGMFTATVYGQLVDTLGRRPFFILASFVVAINSAMVAFLREHIIVSIIFSAFAGLVQQSYVNASIADVYSTKMRMKAMSILIAVSSFCGVLIIITTFLDEDICAYIAFGSSIIMIIVSLFIPETLTIAQERRVEVERRLLNDSIFRRQHPDALEPSDIVASEQSEIRIKCENPFAAMTHLVKSKVMLGAVTIFFFYMMAQVGTGDVYMFYLAERINFTEQDNAYVIVESAILQPLVLMVFLPIALKYISPVMIILFSLSMLIAELVTIATLWALWPVFAIGVPLVAFTQLLQPVLTGIVQNAGNERDQGRRMTGLQAFTDFADALGPLLFGLMFGKLDKALVFLPFVVCAGLVVIPVIISLRLNKWMKDEADARVIVEEVDGQQQTAEEARGCESVA
jgi:MFS family permease